MVFGFAFQSWAKSLRNSTDRILSKLEGLIIEFHNHRVDIENRVTRVETKVDIEALERREERLTRERNAELAAAAAATRHQFTEHADNR